MVVLKVLKAIGRFTFEFFYSLGAIATCPIAELQSLSYETVINPFTNEPLEAIRGDIVYRMISPVGDLLELLNIPFNQNLTVLEFFISILAVILVVKLAVAIVGLFIPD